MNGVGGGAMACFPLRFLLGIRGEGGVGGLDGWLGLSGMVMCCGAAGFEANRVVRSGVDLAGV